MYRIALVVDKKFGSRVMEISREFYIWLVQSPDNDRWARRLWEKQRDSGDPLLHGVSTFEWKNNEHLDSLIVRLLDMIDEHHGEYAHDPEWSEIVVFGAFPTPNIEEAARSYGVIKCEPTKQGFRLTRLPAGRDNCVITARW